MSKPREPHKGAKFQTPKARLKRLRIKLREAQMLVRMDMRSLHVSLTNAKAIGTHMRAAAAEIRPRRRRSARRVK